MATFVLVSGAWHAGWCWERIVPMLQAKGHTALAPDLLGMGPDKTPLAEVSLAVWADQIAGLIEAQGQPVILVGHSRGGVVISETAERVPGRIRTLVYLTAVLGLSGQTGMEAAGGDAPAEMGDMMKPSPDGTLTLPAEAAAKWFYNTTAPEWTARAQSLFTPEPASPILTPLQLTDAGFGSMRRAYIECARDAAMTLTIQRRMQAALPCDPVITLQTDHSPFYSDPEALTDALCAIAAAP